MGQHGYNHGDLGWTELTTGNALDALDFYANLAGWEKKGEPAPGYHIFGKGDEMLGGIREPKDGEPAPRWMPYITVSDLDAALIKAENLGAKVIMPSMDLPEECGRIAIILDPQGVATGLAQYKVKD